MTIEFNKKKIPRSINNGEFMLNGEKHVLAKNFLGKHSLHGGVIGFDKFNWDSHVDGTTVYLTHVSPDEYEGYPGTVLVSAECKLSDDDAFSMNVSAVSSKPTIINMSNHSYFNLAGHGAGYKELYKHKLTINSDKTLKITPEQIPTGEFQEVGDTCFDFRLPVELGTAISKTPGNGFDHSFCVTSGSAQSLTFVARVVHPTSGRTMEIYSDQSSVLFYTSNNLPDPCGNVSFRFSKLNMRKS
jgi:aldose 1-epimerase